ncbi:hypothetical protein D3C80_1319670 [compost metagenome]
MDALTKRNELRFGFVGIVLIAHPQLFIAGERVIVMRVRTVEAMRHALEFHIQAAITLCRQRHTHDIPRIRHRETREFGVSKNGAALWLREHFREFAGAIKHKHQFGE